jgi:hypothetical protein
MDLELLVKVYVIGIEGGAIDISSHFQVPTQRPKQAALVR